MGGGALNLGRGGGVGSLAGLASLAEDGSALPDRRGAGGGGGAPLLVEAAGEVVFAGADPVAEVAGGARVGRGGGGGGARMTLDSLPLAAGEEADLA